MNTPRAATPMAFIHRIVQAYHARGLDPTAALAHAQLSSEALANDSHVTALQMEWLSEHAMRELDDEALGWFGRRLPWGSYGMLVRASLSAPTLGVALQRWCRHHGLLTDSITLSLASDAGNAHLRLTEHPATHDLAADREFCIISTLRNALGVASWLIDSRIPLRQVTLHFAPTLPAPDYTVLLGDAVRFAPHTLTSVMSFDAGYLQLPLRRDEAALRQMLKRALPLMVRPYRRDRRLVAQVAHLLASQADALRTAPHIAQALHLSERSLHRQLQEEGTTWQTLKDQARRQQAEHLLTRTDLPIKQIAHRVGFNNDKSFSRAFKTWAGVSPQAFRLGGTVPSAQP